MSSILNYTLDLVEIRKLKRKKERELKQKIPAFNSYERFPFSLEEREFIQEKMYDLDFQEFFVLYLKHWKDFNVEDISKLLSIEESLVKETLASGTKELKEMYFNEFYKWKKNLRSRMLQF